MHATRLPAAAKQTAAQRPCRNKLNPATSHRQLVLCAAASRAAIGIDLGTTNSVVAVLREGETYPTVIQDSSSGTFTIPSVVTYEAAADKPLVGAAARQQAASNSANTFYSVKRLMGRSWDEVQGLGPIYALHKTPDCGVELVCPAKDTTLTPQQVNVAIIILLVVVVGVTSGYNLTANAGSNMCILLPDYTAPPAARRLAQPHLKSWSCALPPLLLSWTIPPHPQAQANPNPSACHPRCVCPAGVC